MDREMIAKIVTAVHANARGGPWSHYFRREGVSHQCILFPWRMLSPEEYHEIEHRLRFPERGEAGLTAAEVQRNKLRARTLLADEGGHRYG